jgi:hypothetical protein
MASQENEESPRVETARSLVIEARREFKLSIDETAAHVSILLIGVALDDEDETACWDPLNGLRAPLELGLTPPEYTELTRAASDLYWSEMDARKHGVGRRDYV